MTGFRLQGPGITALIARAQVEAEAETEIPVSSRPASTASILEFFDIPTGDAFDVAPDKAISFFKAKGLQPTFSYADMLGASHAHAFTVAKMMDVDMLGQLRASLDSALANGTGFKEWKDSILPVLHAGGWAGRKAVKDPLTGQDVVTEITAPWRLETIFRTNMQSAYAAGNWQEIVAQKDVAPFLMYDAVDDFRTRPLHRAWDRTILPVTSNWWKTHYPPNGYNCRCGVIQLDADQAKSLGLQVNQQPPATDYVNWTNPRTGEIEKVPAGIDPGFGFNVGEAYLNEQQKLLAEKVNALPADMRHAAASAAAQAEAVAQQAVEAAQQAQIALAKAQGEAALARAKALAEAKAAQWAAKAQVDAIAKGKEVAGAGANLKIKALQQLKKGEGWAELNPTEQLQQINDTAALLKKKAVLADQLSKYKKAVLAGKTPPPAAIKGFDALQADEKAAFLAKIDAEKAAIDAAKAAEAAKNAPAADVAQVRTGTPPDPALLTQIGPQKGSNPGGLYQDATTGIKWYIKQPASADIARNEVLAAKLYELAGVDVPELHLIDLNGQPAIASRIVDGLKKADAAALARAAGTAEGFATDAWLANWDVVGLGYDNLLLDGGKVLRVDTGGALRYRAQGGLKGSAFGDTVAELQSLRDPSLNRQAQAVFGKLTDAQIEDSVVRVLKVQPAAIRQVVEKFGPADAAERAALVDRLIARRADLERRYPAAAERARRELGAADARPAAAARVTAAEQAEVEASRVNGYGFATDSDQIEDNQVLVHQLRTAAGADATRGFFKLLPGASRELATRIAESAGSSIGVQLSEVRESILAAVKSINYRAGRGELLDAKVVARIEKASTDAQTAIAQLNKAIAEASDPAQLITARDVIDTWAKTLRGVLPDAQAGVAARTLPGQFAAGALPDELAFARAVQGEAPTIKWERKAGQFVFDTAQFERSFATESGGKALVNGVQLRYEATLADGTRITYFPHDGQVAYALQGVVRIDVPGKGVVSTERVFGAMDEIGLKSTRATEVDRQHLYLNAFARIRLLRGPAASYRAQFDAITDRTAEGVQAKLDLLKKATGVDVAASDGWKTVDGVRQAFGHGRAYQFRPDLDTPEFQRFEREHYLFHNPQGLGSNSGSGVFERLKTIIEGGGTFSSLTDRIRRGVPLSGSSVSSDLASGGGDYHFTRIASRSNDYYGTGVYWKASRLRRMDAITYDSDRFGRTTGRTVDDYRLGQDVQSLRSAAQSNGNETIFKGGLSIFDDLDRIVLSSESEVAEAIAWMKKNGYSRWPDGRDLEQVIITKAKHAKRN